MKNQRGYGLVSILVGAAVAIVLAIGIWSLTSWKKVPAGNVGVHVYLLGGEKGVDAVVRGVGRHFIGWQQELYLYPTFTQNVKWQETSDYNTSLAFSDVDGTSITADVGMSYRVEPTKAAALFQEFRKPIEDITDGQIRQAVTNALNGEAGQLKVDQIYGKGREALLLRVETRVKKEFAPKGILIERLSWLGPPRLPKLVQDSLTAKIQATQIAVQRENEVQATIAEAQKNREEAKGQADAQLLRARAEAESIQIKGEALRNNPALVELERVNAMKILYSKWNGQGQPVPTHTFGNAPVMFQVPGN